MKLKFSTLSIVAVALGMIALSAVQSSTRAGIRNAISFIDTPTMLDTTMSFANLDAVFDDDC